MGNGRKNIITYGTSDTFHYGHMELLKRASSFGDNLIMGDDWTGKFDDFKKYCEVIYLPRTDDISSTQLKEILNEKN